MSNGADHGQVSTRDHILRVADAMITERGAETLRIADLARRAEIGVPTVYYYFDSREHLIAESELLRYQLMTEPLHEHYAGVQRALTENDEDGFWRELRADLEMAWRLGRGTSRDEILRLLINIWSHEATQERFRTAVDTQMRGWRDIMNAAREHDWIGGPADPGLLVAYFWAASVGQVVIGDDLADDSAAERVGDYCEQILRWRCNHAGNGRSDELRPSPAA